MVLGDPNIRGLAKGYPPKLFGAIVYNSADQSVPQNAWFYLAADIEIWDSATLHDTVTNNSRITVPTTGIYDLTAHVLFRSNTTGRRHASFTISRSLGIGEMADSAGAVAVDRVFPLTAPALLTAGDYVEARAWHNAGGNLNCKLIYFAVILKGTT